MTNNSLKKKSFWSMILQPGKRYSIIVEKDIHISKAVVDFSVPRTTHSEYATSLIVDCEDKKIILCHLSDFMHVTKLQPQADLDINFSEGQKLTLYAAVLGPINNTPHTIHLSGYEFV